MHPAQLPVLLSPEPLPRGPVGVPQASHAWQQLRWQCRESPPCPWTLTRGSLGPQGLGLALCSGPQMARGIPTRTLEGPFSSLSWLVPSGDSILLQSGRPELTVKTEQAGPVGPQRQAHAWAGMTLGPSYDLHPKRPGRGKEKGGLSALPRQAEPGRAAEVTSRAVKPRQAVPSTLPCAQGSPVT